MENETQNNEQEFMKKAIILAKDRNLSNETIVELLEELKVGEVTK